MSKATRKRNKLARQLAHEQKGEPPVSDNMIDRMQAIHHGYQQQQPQGSWTNYKGSWQDWVAGKPSSSSSQSSHGGHVFHSSRDPYTFTCKQSDEVEGKCPIAKVPDIHVPRAMWDTFIELADACDTEWIALLLGTLPSDTQKAAVITGFYFPPQTATSTSVDIPTGVKPKAGVIGAIHSHVDMSAFFSGTDKAHSNWPLEIVINSKGNYDSLIRFQLKCGSYTKQKSEVFLLGDKPDPPMWPELSRAFSLGAKLAKRKIAPDESPEPLVHTAQVAQSLPAASQGQEQLVLIGGVQSSGQPDGSGTGTKEPEYSTRLYSDGTVVNEPVPDDGSAIHEPSASVQTNCDRCDGTGMMDFLYPEGAYGWEICDKCNGWGKLLDGKPISPGQPETVEI